MNASRMKRRQRKNLQSLQRNKLATKDRKELK